MIDPAITETTTKALKSVSRPRVDIIIKIVLGEQTQPIGRVKLYHHFWARGLPPSMSYP